MARLGRLRRHGGVEASALGVVFLLDGKVVLRSIIHWYSAAPGPRPPAFCCGNRGGWRGWGRHIACMGEEHHARLEIEASPRERDKHGNTGGGEEDGEEQQKKPVKKEMNMAYCS